MTHLAVIQSFLQSRARIFPLGIQQQGRCIIFNFPQPSMLPEFEKLKTLTLEGTIFINSILRGWNISFYKQAELITIWEETGTKVD